MGLNVEVGSTVTQNFALTVATSTQVVEVQASAPLVATSSASLGTPLSTRRKCRMVPLNGRHFVDAAQLTTGTVEGNCRRSGI